MADTASQFVSFYPHALLYLTRQGDLEALGVLLALCTHVDGFGGCDPGDARLSELVGHRRDRIPDILERLQAVDYIHIILTAVPYRQKPLRGFQVSPYVLRLRSENQTSALNEWQRYKAQTNGVFTNLLTVITYGENDQQPDQNQNQNQKPALKPESQAATDQPASTNAEGVIRAKAPLKREGQEPETAQEQGEARAELVPLTNGQAVQGSAPPPVALPPQWEPKTLAHYKRALADENDENLALDVVSLAGDMSRENARMLVDTYGWDWVTWVMSLYRKQSYSVEHPARWIRAMLRKTTTELRQREG